MIQIAKFIPNVENSDLFEEFNYLFGCICSDEEFSCKVPYFKEQHLECPITTQ